jgi:FKBP-type peptidyl-prolyl cis-trans isomerase FklB
MQLRRTLGIGLGLFAVAAFAVAQQAAAPKAPPTEDLPGGAAAPAALNLKTLKERSSYAIGADIGHGLKEQGVDLDVTILARGLADSLEGRKSLMCDKEIKETMIELQKLVETQHSEARAKLIERNKLLGEKNKVDGPAFLAENKKREGVKTLASGLQYKVLREGKGATPKLTDSVTTHYRGKLLDGTEFDSSYARGEPANFPVKGVIPGWTEALQLMKEGDKWQLYVPANLAYGERGAGLDIPPNATLIFDIELLKVEPGEAAPAPDEKAGR